MFSITGISLKNFKSYAGDHEFEFPTENGLYFLTGDNKREPALGSNGAGKSTLLDAIYWCLYGRSLRGLKAADIVTWGEKSCSVSLDLVVADQEFTLTRTQNPNSFELEGRPIESIAKYIELNADAFVYSVILPQFGQSFFELKPAEKLTLFSQIMNLDFWLEKSQQAAEATKELEQAIEREKSSLQSTKDIINDTTADIQTLKQNENDFEANRQNELKVMGLNNLKLENDLDQLTESVRLISKSLKNSTIHSNTVAARYNELSKQSQKLGTAYTKVKSEIEAIVESLEALSTIKGKCPTCRQPLDLQHREIECKKLEAMLDKKELERKALTEQWNATIVLMETAETKCAEAKNDHNNMRTRLAVETSKIDGLMKRGEDAKQDVKDKKNEVNPYSEMVTVKKAKLRSLADRLLAHQDKLAALNADHTATSYWVNGFKRIRLFIIEETLRSLELEVNNSLASLGLVDWQIEFDVERENKSGGVTKGFVVFIRCPSNPEPVRWESWSGGETQRLQLAGDFGLANLIMLQAGLANTIEFYDEPSDHLSDEGLNDLADTLQQRAINEGKRIILVDHRMPEFGDFAGVYRVTKNDKGSRLTHEPRQ